MLSYVLPRRTMAMCETSSKCLLVGFATEFLPGSSPEGAAEEQGCSLSEGLQGKAGTGTWALL